MNFKNKVRKLGSLTFPKPETYQKFLDYANERSKFGNPDFIHLNQQQQHHCLSQAKVRRQEQAIAQLKKVLAQCNIFKGSHALTGRMFKLVSKEILPDNVKDSILSTETVSMGAYQKFVAERVTGNENL